MIKETLSDHWLKYLSEEFDKDYMKKLLSFLEKEYKEKIIYPEQKYVFTAFNSMKLEDVKVVILGQDPYHGEGQAHGLSFSVNKGMKIPPSLRNIYKELSADLGIETPNHGYLDSWAKQGVLLLNNTLTVEKSLAGSHQKKGWELFTDKIIEVLNDECENLVFILWGGPAQKKGKSIDEQKHCVLKAPHPSPLSSYRGFFGCKHFSKANNYLRKMNKTEIDWGKL
tara:strand:- start:51 stop:725 length:675 start_codon:yes stop_codon:yes gene_type:complete